MSKIFNFQYGGITEIEPYKVWIYLPDNYDTAKNFPVIYMNDGQNLFYDNLTKYGKCWHVKETMDYLYKTEKIAMIIVGIEHKQNRTNQLSPWSRGTITKKSEDIGGHGDEYSDFIARQLKPYIDANYKTNAAQKFTAIAGSSFGALSSLYTAIKHSYAFSTVGAFSDASWVFNKYRKFLKETYIEYAMNFFYYVGGTETDNKVINKMYVDQMHYSAKVLTKKGAKVVTMMDMNGIHFETFWGKYFSTFVRFFNDSIKIEG